MSQNPQSRRDRTPLTSRVREKTLSILHDWSRALDLAHLLLMDSPWIYTDSYIV
jgi:hypothetical protein